VSQTRKGSLVESTANIAVGFGINYGANLALLPVMWDAAHPAASSFHIGLVFTAISLVRSYVLRRWFNGLRFGHSVEVVK
jgi:hypothetical protein